MHVGDGYNHETFFVNARGDVADSKNFIPQVFVLYGNSYPWQDTIVGIIQQLTRKWLCVVI